MTKLRRSISIALALASGASGPAQSAEDPTGAAGGEQAARGGLEEIIVTAQRREEGLQDIPIAVTALSAEVLATRGVENMLDLNSTVPALSFTTIGAVASPRIRGVGTAIAQAGNENSVATYIDGVYMASSSGSLMSFNNLEQVAVLKGPQGTLFGRNATGGLIQITTRTPTQEFDGSASVTLGNLETVGANLYLTGGITDNLAADIAVYYRDQGEGFGKNLFNGRDVNKFRDLAIRSKWLATIGDATTATLSLDYADSASSVPGFRPDTASLPLTGVPFAGGDFDVDSNIQPFSDNEQYGIALNVTHDFGSTKLVSITAYRHSDWNAAFDSDSLPINVIHARVTSPDRQFSQEFQLLSAAGGPLDWMLGAYYFDGRGGYEPGIVTAPALNFISTIDTQQGAESFALFGQATYAITTATSLTVGLRWTSETKSMDGGGSLFLFNPGVNIPQGPYETSEKVEKPTWRLAIDHRFSDDILAYVSYNRGFKSGGYDPTSTAVPVYFEPEVLDAYEVGVKSEFADRRVRVNGAAYYYDYTDIQLNTFVQGLLSIYNGDSAEIYGVDVDLQAAPTDRLTLTAGVAYVHGRYGDFPITQTATVPTGGVIRLPDMSADGKRLQQTPDWQVNVGFEYRLPLPAANVDLAADYFYSDRWYGTPENRLSQEPYSLVNASLNWIIDADEKYSLRVWGRNLGDEFYAVQLTTQVPVTDFVAAAPGRTFGATFTARF